MEPTDVVVDDGADVVQLAERTVERTRDVRPRTTVRILATRVRVEHDVCSFVAVTPVASAVLGVIVSPIIYSKL